MIESAHRNAYTRAHFSPCRGVGSCRTSIHSTALEILRILLTILSATSDARFHIGILILWVNPCMYILSVDTRSKLVPWICFVGRLTYQAGGMRIVVRGKQASRSEAPILVLAPHSTFIDGGIVYVTGFPSIIVRRESGLNPFVGSRCCCFVLFISFSFFIILLYVCKREEI